MAIINLADPERWVLEQILPSVGGRTLSMNGHNDIVRCAHLDTKASGAAADPARLQSVDSDLLQTSTVVTGGEDGRICLWKL